MKQSIQQSLSLRGSQITESKLLIKVQQLELQNEHFKMQIAFLQQQKSVDDEKLRAQMNKMEQEIMKIKSPKKGFHRHANTTVTEPSAQNNNYFSEKSPVEDRIKYNIKTFFQMAEETPIINKLCNGSMTNRQEALLALSQRQYLLLLADTLEMLNSLIDSFRKIPITVDTPKREQSILQNDFLTFNKRLKTLKDSVRKGMSEFDEERVRLTERFDIIGRPTLSSIHLSENSEQPRPKVPPLKF